MQSRRDLYQAHRLMMQRVGLALLQGEPDVAESPMRRLSVGVLGGATLAIVLIGVFAIVGLIRPGGAKGLDKGDTIIIEKETGTKYIYDTNSRKLLPVANYASALLALNKKGTKPRSVSRKSLNKFERGPMIGIAGAPDSLPAADQLIRGPWSVCVREADGGTGVRRPMTALAAGRKVGGRTLPAGEALVVQAAGQSWVIWKDRRMSLRLPPAQVSALTGGAQPAQVAPAWLNSIPATGDFAAPQVPGQRGRQVRGPGGQEARVGQIFKADTGGGTNWYVTLDDGLAQISGTQARLLLSDPATKAAYPGRLAEALPTDMPSATATQSRTRLYSDALPATMPKFVQWTTTEPLCAVYSGGTSTTAQLTLGGQLPPPSVTALGVGTSGGGAAVDQLVLPPGGASLVRLAPGAGAAGAVGSLSIINDQGIRYAIPSAEIAANLGYDAAKAAPVPASVLHLIPAGPALDPKAATTPVRRAG
ncbi:type VII secretion protein EccB [Actinomadura viridis]|uniref:Type VII secretion protein EccB n=1 Tax=Actinomadura viridis TaxID=58110 RepID=A0A931DL70_9ACTN|nr:type VII secretion protein EccB [Actinomadura viridis]MBG6093254.1 type VII secretion protein EccB [Actinomadura viridis]